MHGLKFDKKSFKNFQGLYFLIPSVLILFFVICEPLFLIFIKKVFENSWEVLESSFKCLWILYLKKCENHECSTFQVILIIQFGRSFVIKNKRFSHHWFSNANSIQRDMCYWIYWWICHWHIVCMMWLVILQGYLKLPVWFFPTLPRLGQEVKNMQKLWMSDTLQG